MEEAKNKKMNFFTRMYNAIINFDIYSKFAEEPLSKAIKYMLTFILIFSIIVTALFVMILRTELLKGIEYLNENIQDMNFKNGIFSFNDNQYTSYEGEENLVPIVIVDTSDEPDIETYKTKVNLYDYGFIILKDRVLIHSAPNSEFEPIVYAGFGLEDMNKEQLLGWINSTHTYIYMGISIFIVEFMQYIAYILLNAVVLAIVGRLIGMILNLRIPFKATYKMGIYALTLPTILELIYIVVNSTTGFIIQYFDWMYTTISYIYICVAILMIKTDFINTQRELMKIKIEEQKIKQEMNEQTEEKKEEKEKEKSKEENKKEDKDNEGLEEQTEG